MITILFFGRMADIAGQRRIELPLPEDGLGLLALRDRVLPGRTDAQMSVNKQIVRGDQALGDGDEIAFFSVFSGG